MVVNRKRIIIEIIVGISLVVISSIISTLITQKVMSKEETTKNDYNSQQEDIISKLNGGWKSKDNTCLLTTVSGIEFTYSCYLYINNDYGYKSNKKESFTILDNSHLKIGDSAYYFYLLNDRSLIVGSVEYERVDNLVEEDFNCLSDYNCPLYDKMDRQVLSLTIDSGGI